MELNNSRLIQPRNNENNEGFGTGNAMQRNVREPDGQASRTTVLDGLATCLPCLSDNDKANNQLAANRQELAELRAIAEKQALLIQEATQMADMTREVNRMPTEIEFAPVDLSRNLGTMRAKGQGKIPAKQIEEIKARRKARKATNLEKEVALKDKILQHYRDSRSGTEASSVTGSDWLDNATPIQNNAIDISSLLKGGKGYGKGGMKKSTSVVSFEWDDCGESEMNENRFKEFQNLEDKDLLARDAAAPERKEMEPTESEKQIQRQALLNQYKMVLERKQKKKAQGGMKKSASVVSFDWDDCGESEMDAKRFDAFKGESKELLVRDAEPQEVVDIPADLMQIVKDYAKTVERKQKKSGMKKVSSVVSFDWDDCGESEMDADRFKAFKGEAKELLVRDEPEPEIKEENQPLNLSLVVGGKGAGKGMPRTFSQEDIQRVKAHHGKSKYTNYEKYAEVKRKIGIKRLESESASETGSVITYDWDDCGTSDYTQERHNAFLATSQEDLWRHEIVAAN